VEQESIPSHGLDVSEVGQEHLQGRQQLHFGDEHAADLE
jgi:hypothetical protein